VGRILFKNMKKYIITSLIIVAFVGFYTFSSAKAQVNTGIILGLVDRGCHPYSSGLMRHTGVNIGQGKWDYGDLMMYDEQGQWYGGSFDKSMGIGSYFVSNGGKYRYVIKLQRAVYDRYGKEIDYKQVDSLEGSVTIATCNDLD
jgi:hypothetical protein